MLNINKQKKKTIYIDITIVCKITCNIQVIITKDKLH